MSVLNDAMLEGYRRGYYVTEDGVLINPRGSAAGGRPNMQGYLESANIDVPGYTGQRRFRVHRLAAFQWFGCAIFRTGVEVRHLDGNPLNNRRDNIALGSHSENMMDQPVEVRRARATHAASYLRALSAEQAQQLIDDRSSGMTYAELMKKYGVAKGTVSHIVNGKTYPELRRPK